jgi:hypothetical protein
LFMPVLNNAGQTAFYGATFGGGVGLWAERSGSLALVARFGQQAPGTQSGVTFNFDYLSQFLETPVLNDAGQATFRAGLSGPGVTNANNFGLWSEGSGSLQLVARLGSQAQGLPTGVNHGYMFAAGLNDSGQSVFYSWLTGSGVDSTNEHSIWTYGPGGPALLARTGSQAPGMPSGVNFDRFSNTGSINSAGQIAFMAGLSSESSTFGQESLWFADAGNLTLVIRRGDQATGTPSGVTIDEIGYWPALNDSGQILFGSLLAGNGVNANNEGAIFLSDAAGSTTLVLRSGDQAPGTPAGTHFFADRNTIPAWVLNSAGQVAADCRLTGAGVDSTNDFGIWATDRTGALTLVVRKGDSLEVAPGDSRTISELSFERVQ